jgi:hypothetical protein
VVGKAGIEPASEIINQVYSLTPSTARPFPRVTSFLLGEREVVQKGLYWESNPKRALHRRAYYHYTIEAKVPAAGLEPAPKKSGF